MDKDSKERLVLAAAIVIAFSAGATLEYVKVPFQKQTVIVEKTPAIIEYYEEKNGAAEYRISLPLGYELRMDENNNFYGYKEKKIEEIQNIKLGDYLSELFVQKINIR